MQRPLFLSKNNMKKNIFGKNSTIAIIGFGRFGRLLVSILLEFSQARILIISRKKQNLFHKNISLGSIEDIKTADIIIPCVPISAFESAIKKIAPLIKKDAVVIDVCSVKVLPVRWMKKHLLKSTQIIASHPMFGPDSYKIKKNQNDLRFVIHNVNAKKENYCQVRGFFQNMGWKIIELSPENHDKFMAFSLAYSYLVGKVGQRMDIKKTPIDTYDFQLLLDHMSIIKKDSEQLFIDMESQNPYAIEMQKKFKEIISNLIS